MPYDPNSGPAYEWGKDPFYSGNAFRYNTGGASPTLRYAANQLLTGNNGTTYANMAAQQAQRAARLGYTTFANNAMAAGGGGNYNVLAGGAQRFLGNAARESMGAFGTGARINSENMTQGGRLAASADELDQRGKQASLDFISRLKPEFMPGWSEWQQNNYTQNEGFLPWLGKSLLGGSLGSLTGHFFGGLGTGLGNAAANWFTGGDSNGGDRGQPINDDTNQG
ncbi:MAG: hypothetical protein KGJ13_02225 [Patescibacteria group bacterium]|nr:hypothetical protein [Patescibacteria group bacterium]